MRVFENYPGISTHSFPNSNSESPNFIKNGEIHSLRTPALDIFISSNGYFSESEQVKNESVSRLFPYVHSQK